MIGWRSSRSFAPEEMAKALEWVASRLRARTTLGEIAPTSRLYLFEWFEIIKQELAEGDRLERVAAPLTGAAPLGFHVARRTRAEGAADSGVYALASREAP